MAGQDNIGGTPAAVDAELNRHERKAGLEAYFNSIFSALDYYNSVKGPNSTANDGYMMIVKNIVHQGSDVFATTNPEYRVYSTGGSQPGTVFAVNQVYTEANAAYKAAYIGSLKQPGGPALPGQSASGDFKLHYAPVVTSPYTVQQMRDDTNIAMLVQMYAKVW